MPTHASQVRAPEAGREDLGAAGRWCMRQALRALGDPSFSLVAWTGEEFAPRGAPPQGRLRLRERPRLRDLAQGPDGLLANAYVEGRVEVEGDLARLVYARTLEHWSERFEKAAPRVRSQQGARFERTWRLYLASSLAAFRSGSCQLYRVLFARQDDPGLPWTRDWIYRPDAAAAVA